jgi:predicted component of viral defense system (DUF524 family)
MISPDEAAKYGEERLQLVEGQEYQYEVRPLDGVAYQLERDEILVSPWLISTGLDRGTIRTANQAGLLRLYLVGPAGKRVAHADVEIRSVKLGYRDDYRSMLSYIASRAVDLLLRITSPVQARLIADIRMKPETLRERFFFVRGLLTSRQFSDAVHQVASLPHSLLVPEHSKYPVSRRFKPSARALRNIARGGPRVRLPEAHPLAVSMRTQGISEPTLPQSVIHVRSRDTFDTPENRFVKHVLTELSYFLRGIHARLQTEGERSEITARREVQPIKEELDQFLALSFFSDIGELTSMPLGSSVLQRKDGYREILAAWLGFNAAATLGWRAGQDVFGGGKRDVANLYEYWVFFKLVEILQDRLGWIPARAMRSLFDTSQLPFALRVRSGQLLEVDGVEIQAGGNTFRIQFSYNKTFPRMDGEIAGADPQYWRNYPLPGSWTRSLRPDFTLSFWPSGMELMDAEVNDVAAHIHFDAKYSVRSIVELFGSERPDLDAEKSEYRTGFYRRGDLLKMHAYRDAIRRSQGAYIVYPGSPAKGPEGLGNTYHLWAGYHEIVPGLGAFVLRPGQREGSGEESIAAFLRDVLAQLSRRQ